MKSYLFTIQGEPSPPFLFFCRHWVATGETKPGPLPGKGSGVQQALAAEGPASTRPFFFCKADLFFASADAVRAQISKAQSHWGRCLCTVLTPLFV